jgi:hypothetical protein
MCVFAATLALRNARATSVEPSASQNPEIWLATFSPFNSPTDPRRGAPDYLSLFSPEAKWDTSARHVKVFKIYRDQVLYMPDEVIRTIIGGLDARHISLAMETNILVETSVCSPGIDKAKPITPVVERLKRLGANLRYLALDEPLAGGHLAARSRDCHASIDAVARDVAASIKSLLAIYPDLQVGDIEPIGRLGDDSMWPQELGQWIDAFQAETGHKLAFMHADTVWGRPWKEDLKALAAITRKVGVPFGVIYNGDFTEFSDVAWAANTKRYAELVESSLGSVPDHIIFQSWDTWPQHSLPDSDFTTATGMIRDYLRQRTSLKRDAYGNMRLVGDNGSPVALGKVKILVHTDPPAPKSMTPQFINGEVPRGAYSALLALRVNADCPCPRADANFMVSDFTYSELPSETSATRNRFDWDFGEWHRQAPDIINSLRIDGRHAISVSSPSGRGVILNSPRFPVTAAATFHATFSWDVSTESEEIGYIAIVFLGANGVETRRTLQRFQTSWHEVAELRTKKDGLVNIPSRYLTRIKRVPAMLEYEGDMHHRPASARLQ